MGGIDLLDCFMAQNRKTVVTRRWYVYLFWHTVYIGLTNAWLSYRRDCERQNIRKKEIMIKRKCVAQVETSLVQVNVSKLKRGRPSAENLLLSPPAKRKLTLVPTDDVRFDTINHLPEKKLAGKEITTWKMHSLLHNSYCTKRSVRLCLSE